MGRACSTNRIGYWWESQKEREDRDMGGWIILKWILERLVEVVWTEWTE
jgi:hypothetical protein